MGDEIVIDRKTLKALGADTRLEILRVLLRRQHMLTELSSALGMSHSTVKEHMTVLEQAGLVKRFDEGRKWKYYRLTMKGKKLVAPEEVKALFILVFSGIAAAGLVVRELLVKTVSRVIEEAPAGGGKIMAAPLPAAGDMIESAAAGALPLPGAPEAGAQAAGIDPWAVLLVVVLIVLVSAAGFLVYRNIVRRRQQ